jgi:hypothetical protein
VDPGDARVAVTVKDFDAQGMTLAVSGAATLTFHALAPATAYRLTVDGKEETRHTPAGGRSLRVETGAGTHAVALRALAPSPRWGGRGRADQRGEKP